MSLGLYIHVPFCRQACSYCDFYFVTREEWIERYVDALEAEIRGWSGDPLTRRAVETIYFGGGTPSRLDLKQVGRLMAAVRGTFETDLQEVTFEMNPDDVSGPFLQGLREEGVDRASMGVQTFDSERLIWMNRSHDSDQAHRALELLSTTGFSRFTVDLIYGSPDQTTDDLARDVEALLAYDPPHLSAYALTIEPRTRLGKQLEKGRLKPADEEEVARQMRWLMEALTERGLPPYEVSNFSRPGAEAVHNTNYWNHTPYLGFGPGAHSFRMEEDQGWRWSNESDLRSWIDRIEKGVDTDWQLRSEHLGLQDLAEERLMLSLRTRWGVSMDELEGRYSYSLTDEQRRWMSGEQRNGRVQPGSDRIGLTEEGRVLADYLIVELIRRGH